MANSSDWMAVLNGTAPDSAPDQAPSLPGRDLVCEPGWIAALRAPADFVEGMNFVSPNALAPSSAASTTPTAHTAHTAVDPLEQAFEDGHAQGYAKGYGAGQAEAQNQAQTEAQATREQHAEQIRAMQALRLNFRSLDQTASDALADDLADTVVALCRRVLTDFAADPQVLIAHCHEAARRMGTGVSQCKLHLNSHDLAAFDPAILEQWDVVEDDTIARGGLRFQGPDGAVSHGPDDWACAIAAAIRG